MKKQGTKDSTNTIKILMVMFQTDEPVNDDFDLSSTTQFVKYEFPMVLNGYHKVKSDNDVDTEDMAAVYTINDEEDFKTWVERMRADWDRFRYFIIDGITNDFRTSSMPWLLDSLEQDKLNGQLHEEVVQKIG